MSGRPYQWLLPLFGGLCGLLASFIWPAQHGTELGCPRALAGPTSCWGPPNLALQHLGWTAIGVAIGAATAFIVRLVAEARLGSSRRA